MNWRTYTWPFGRGVLPSSPAVYAIYLSGELCYIGQTVDLRNRFCEHAIRYGYARNIVFPWCIVPDETVVTVKVGRSFKYGDWAMRELRLIRRLRPKFNQHCLGRKLKLA